ncbi:MAG: CotH kinase family protein [Putridiphycobacter sp.]
MKLVLFIYIIFWGLLATAQVNFEPQGGLHNEPVQVKLSTDSSTTIYYTLDGSTPTSGSKKYNTPINIKKVGIIRAVTYINGKKSEVITQSYFCDRDYTLPVVSVVSDPGNFWDFSRGIYVKGCCADTIEPYMGANYWKSWERLCNVEMYQPNGDLCFNQLAGMSIFGGFSRALPQKSLAIIARGRYGEKKFDYPIFKNRKHKKYKSFILRNSGGDFKRTHLRDAYMTQLAKPTGVAIQEYEPVIVFLNGEYWGIQNIREKINEHYLAQNFDVDKDNVDILRQNGVRRHGYSKQYKYLLSFLRTHDLALNKNVEELSKFMDIHDFIRYNIAEVYSDNRDAGGNIRYWKERNDKSKWRWVLYDLDLGLGNNNYSGYKRNTLKKFTSVNAEKWPDPAWSTFIIRKLLENQNLRFKYINNTCDYLNTVYHPDTAIALLDRMVERIEPEMAFHVKKWGTSLENWKFHLDIVRTFVKERPKYMREHLKQKFELGNEINIKIVVPNEKNCKITFNDHLKIKENFSGIYYENIPVSIEVKTDHDYEFVGWKNREEKTPNLTFVPLADVVLQPIIQPKKPSVFKDSLIINEISFYQPETDTVGDWVEIYNRSNQTIDLNGFTFSQHKFKGGFLINTSLSIEPEDFIILANKRTSFLAKYPGLDSNKVIGNFDFGLSKSGEKILLYDQEELIIDSLTFGGIKEGTDTLFTSSLTHPDSTRYDIKNWAFEKPTPLKRSIAYQHYLDETERYRIWKQRLYYGGGGFFFICLLGIMWFRYSRKKHKKEPYKKR